MNYNKLSHSMHYLHMSFINPENKLIDLSTGTGFIYECDDIYYLITNGHNVTGLNPATNKPNGRNAVFPTKMRFKIWEKNIDKPSQMKQVCTSINLYKDDEFTQPNWYVHPTYEHRVDVVAIPIATKQNVENKLLYPIKPFFPENHSLEVTDDVFIVGYPMDYTQAREFPIWKRGSIATEPNFDWDNLPKFLIDAQTKSGMSGSLVFMRREGIHNFSLENLDNTEIGRIETFAGIYSGRINTNNNDVELGIVWKKQVIKEIIKGNKKSIDFQTYY